MEDPDDERDPQEEEYLRNLCPNCGESPCIGAVCLADQGRK